MLNKIHPVVLVLLSFGIVVLLFYGYNYYENLEANKLLDASKEDVYVRTAFNDACIKLHTRYTPEQWASYQDLNEKAFGYQLTRCN